MDDPAILALAAGFPAIERSDWSDAVTRVLGGRTPEDLAVATPDGIRLEPLYSSSDSRPGHPGLAPFTRGATATVHAGEGWAVRQAHLVGRSDVNDAVLTDLEGGATELLLIVRSPADLAELDGALAGVHLDLAPLALDAGPHGLAAAYAVESLWDRSGLSGSARLGALRIDPLGSAARHGVLPQPLDTTFDGLTALATRSADRWPNVTTAAVDTTPYTDAGCSDAVDLAVSMATGVAYLRVLLDGGLDIESACGELEFTYAVAADQFSSIAKLRAARRLWCRVAEVCGATYGARAQRQHAVTAATMYTRRDPWVNMLRATVACFSAAVGGARSITVSPFDTALGVSDGFAERIARNTQLLLAEESHLGDVIDPGGGSWYLETLTDELAHAAWAHFQEIEAQGGMLAALDSGWIAARIGDQATASAQRVARRHTPLTGVSEFPHLDEEPVTRPPLPATVVEPQVSICSPLPVFRPAAAYERLRDRADDADGAPTVFLANLGPAAAHNARSSWAANAFEAGGVRALDSDGFATAEEVVEAFCASGARLAVICGSDASYDEMVLEVAPALKRAGCERLYLAGTPADRRAADVAAGVDEHVHVGVDLIDVLTRAHDVVGAE